MEVQDDFQVVYQVDKGILIDLFDKLLKKSGLQKQVLAALLGLDPRTVDNYRKKAGVLGLWKGSC